MYKLKRKDFAAFLNTGTIAVPVWSRMGQGITSQTLTYNASKTTETYIHQDNANNSVDSYAPTMDTPQTAYAGDPVFDYVDDLRKTRAVGSEAQGELLLVYIYDEESTGVYKAEKNNCTITIGDFGGEGGGNVVLNYTIDLDGDPTLGTATITGGTVTFTPDSV
jgi:hypothetical protein